MFRGSRLLFRDQIWRSQVEHFKCCQATPTRPRTMLRNMDLTKRVRHRVRWEFLIVNSRRLNWCLDGSLHDYGSLCIVRGVVMWQSRTPQSPLSPHVTLERLWREKVLPICSLAGLPFIGSF